MAEGRSAALLFHLQKRGFNVTGSTPDSEDDGYVLVKLKIPLPKTIWSLTRSSLTKSFFNLQNGLWPASPATLLTVVSGVTLLTVFAESDSWLRSGWLADWLWKLDTLLNPLHSKLSVSVRVGYLAAFASVVGFLGIVSAERLFLRFLLSLGPAFFIYRGGKNQPKNLVWSYLVHLWTVLMQNVPGRRNMTFGFQMALPLLPVPYIEATTRRWLKSVEPLLSKAEYQKASSLVQQFRSNEGPRLNFYLKCRTFFLNNYVSPWWEQYVYLKNRSSLLINCNYYVMDSYKPSPVKDQVFRAANLVHNLLRFQDQISFETLEPLMMNQTVPLCMHQYRKLFGTCRIPGRESDTVKHVTDSNYIVCVRRGRFYKVLTRRLDQDNQRLTAAELAHQFRLITEHANLDAASRGPNCEEKDICALTCLSRTRWAEIRDGYFGEGMNRKALLTIEKAAFIVHLVTESSSSSSPNTSPKYSSTNSPNNKFSFAQTPETQHSLLRRAHFLYHGEGSELWLDKSFNLVVFEDGYAGLNAEHSHADAPVIAHMWEHAVLQELIDFEADCDASSVAGESLRGQALPMPLKLDFDISDQLSNEIKNAKKEAKVLVKDLDLDVLYFDAYGADFIKQKGVAPDAYMQVSLLLTLYENNGGKIDLAYESCHTRLFREGRTETIRPVTNESVAFVKSAALFFKDPSKLADKQQLSDCRKLLAEACQVHQNQSRDSLAGRGIDRHLFALTVVARGLEIKSEFLEYAHSTLTWTLSSAQQPQNQTRLREFLPPKVVNEFFSPGGGFAPIDDSGYGVSYSVLPKCFFFHVTSKRSQTTNSRRFVTTLKQVLELMKRIVEDN